jgi:hypothetical protein
MRVRPCPNQSARKLTAKSKRAEAEPPQGEVNVKTKIVKVEAPATGVTETGTAVVKARGVMPDPPSPARKPADREAAAFENIARQLDCFVEITDAMTPEQFLSVSGSYTPLTLSRIVDDARLAVEWLTRFMELARALQAPGTAQSDGQPAEHVRAVRRRTRAAQTQPKLATYGGR